jgi:hypothetical protein
LIRIGWNDDETARTGMEVESTGDDDGYGSGGIEGDSDFAMSTDDVPMGGLGVVDVPLGGLGVVPSVDPRGLAVEESLDEDSILLTAGESDSFLPKTTDKDTTTPTTTSRAKISFERRPYEHRRFDVSVGASSHVLCGPTKSDDSLPILRVSTA